MNKVMIGDVPCGWREIKPAKLNNFCEKTYCPVCNEEIDELESRIILINNYLLFPNIFCHLKCFSKDKAEEIILCVKKNYEQSKAILEKALYDGKPWFSYIKV